MAVSLKKKSKTSKRGRRGLSKSKPKHKGGFTKHTTKPARTHAPEHSRMPTPFHTKKQHGGETSPSNIPVIPPMPAMPTGMTAMPSGMIAMPSGMMPMPTGTMSVQTLQSLKGGYSKKNSKSHSRSKKSRKHIKKMRR